MGIAACHHCVISASNRQSNLNQKPLKKLLLLSFSALSFFILRGQTSQGTDFWIASTYPFYSSDTFTIAVASEKPTTAYLEIPLSNYKDSVKLGYNDIKYMIIPPSLRSSYYYYYSTAAKKIGDNAIHVSSPLPVRVYSFSGGKYYSCGATAVYPTSSQPPGGVYYPYKARYYTGGPTSSYKIFFFTVVGVDDSVTVSFNSNSSALWNLPPGNKILLRRGQMVRIYTYLFGFDPTLQVVASSGKKIAVFTENFYDYAQAGCFQYDLMYEQLLPDNILGTDFILTPFMYHKKGYDYTLTATVSNTIIKKDGNTLDTLDLGETYYGRMYSDSSVLITANNPINCWEKNILDTCQSTWGWWFSGPSIMTISTSTQLITDAVVSVPANSTYTDNFINIITTKYGKDSVWLDGTQIPPSQFKSILNGTFYLFRDTIIRGNHRLTCNYGFISYIYGRGQYGGYAYNASAGLQSLKRYILTKTYQSCDTGRLVKLTSEGDPGKNYQWSFNGQNDTGLVAWFQVAKPGTYAVKLKYILLRNNQWDSVYTNLEIKGNEKYDWIVGQNINICQPSTSFSLPKSKLFRYKWSTGDTVSNLTVNTSGKYSLVVTNTNSGCKFYDTALVSLFAKMTPGIAVSMQKNCPGYPINLKNTTTFAGTDSAKSVQWYVDNLYHNNTKNDTVKKSYPGTYNFRLVINSANGCTDSVAASIKVGAAPTVISGMNIYDSCYASASYKFNSRSSLSLGKIVGYKWLFSDGDTNYKKTQALRTFHDSGLYTYRFIAFSDAGCSDTTAPKYFRVYSAPQPKFSIPDSSVCLAGNYFSVKNQSVTFGKPSNYQWIWGDGSGETFDEPGTKNYTDTGKYLIQLVAAYNSTGCTDTFRRYVRVLPNPKASMVIDSSNFCLNNSYYAFRETGNTKGALVKYVTWNWGDGTQTKDSLHYKKHYTKTGTFKVTLYFSTGKGCMDSAKKNVVVYASPKAVISIADSNICGNKNYINLGNASTAPANAKWTWAYGDGNTSTAKTPGKISYSGFGKYTISLVAYDPLVTCSDTARRMVNILKSPSLDARISDSMVCDTSGQFTFTDSTKYGNLKPWRLWTINGSATDTSYSQSISRKFKTSGMQQIKLVGGLAGVCADTQTYKVNVRYLPGPTLISITKTITAPCVNGVVDFGSKITQGSSWSYFWDAGNGKNDVTANVTGVSFKDSGKHYVSLKITDDKGCNYQTRDSFRILPKPIVNLLKLSTDTQCLSNNKYQFNSSTQYATTPVSYTWDLDESNASALSQTNPVIYKNPGTKNIVLRIADANGCKDTANSTVFANPSPIVTIKGDSFCLGNSTVLVPDIQPTGISVSKTQWYLDNVASASSTNFNYKGITAGLYQVKLIVIATGGCADTSNFAAIRVFPKPIAKFGVNLKNAIGTGVPADFLDSSTGATQWTWIPDTNDKFINSNKQKLSWLYPHLGDMTAMLIVANAKGCKDTSSITFLLKSDELVWMPNTFTPDGNGKNDLFKPEGLSAVKTYSMVIYNRWGNKIFETTDPMQGWDGYYMGAPAMQGSYAYSVNIVFLTGRRLAINDNFTLVR